MTSPPEPSWCVRTDHDGQASAAHVSTVHTVGSRRPFAGRGEVTAWLQQDDEEPAWVGVGVAHMAYVTVEISLDDADRHIAHLTDLVRQARAAVAERFPRSGD